VSGPGSPAPGSGIGWLAADLPAGVLGGFTTREWGVSEGPFARGNLATHVGDDPARVAANRLRLGDWLAGLGLAAPTWLDQVHGAVVHRAGAVGPPTPTADATVTADAGRAVAVLTADCVPVLLADPVAGVVAAAHAGRVGLAAGVLDGTVEAMVDAGADPARTTAVIGPAVCGECYEVPAEMRDEVAARVPDVTSQTASGTPALDLPRGAHALLSAAGVATVRRLAVCTRTDPRLFSHRRDTVTGRFAAVVGIPTRPRP
jgi:polyphenol oxidase